ncbi:hypothetical protein [Streptacidiphilus sp. EB129]|jgi:hypothetical protein|uniref:hypothetical protein n=1 Tax=Streptacidiphilus sp. EB129 TaxID=3156262 RepID=UPI003518BCB1
MLINYDGRRFRPQLEGEEGRVATYHQDGDLLWGEFTGGLARRGSLAGRASADGSLEFAYCMVRDSGEVISGYCRSIPRLDDEGRIVLEEAWERYGRHAARGVSRLVELFPGEEPVTTSPASDYLEF